VAAASPSRQWRGSGGRVVFYQERSEQRWGSRSRPEAVRSDTRGLKGFGSESFQPRFAKCNFKAWRGFSHGVGLLPRWTGFHVRYPSTHAYPNEASRKNYVINHGWIYALKWVDLCIKMGSRILPSQIETK
jgi:hypothetical protein